MIGTLYLIPSALSECETDEILPLKVKQIICTLHFFIVENERTARRFLVKAGYPSIANAQLMVLDKHKNESELSGFLDAAMKGSDIGLITEAGAPAVADPGAVMVKLAHEKNIRVKPLVGPSSILLALMASGMNGQSFSFHGYLPIESKDRIAKIKELERISGVLDQTQVFIETPYRNNPLLADIISCCSARTLLGIASNITASDERIETHAMEYWKSHLPDINKKPTVFTLYSIARAKKTGNN